MYVCGKVLTEQNREPTAVLQQQQLREDVLHVGVWGALRIEGVYSIHCKTVFPFN